MSRPDKDKDKTTPKTMIKIVDKDKTIPKTKTKAKTKIEDKDKTILETKTKAKTEDKNENRLIKVFRYVRRDRENGDLVKRQIVIVYWNNKHISELCEK